MHHEQPPTDANARGKRFFARDGIAILAGIVAVILWGVSAFRDHARGEDWRSAIGFTFDRGLLQILGDFAVPVMMVVLLMQAVRKLPPSRTKKKLAWICWILFVFLFVWWSPLHVALFGP